MKWLKCFRVCWHEILLCQTDVQSILSGDALSVSVSVFFWQRSPKLSGSIIGLYVQFFVDCGYMCNKCMRHMCAFPVSNVDQELITCFNADSAFRS